LPVERGLRLSAEDQRRRTIVMRLMCDRRLDFGALSKAPNVDFTAQYGTELASLSDLERDGVVERTADALRVTPLGVPLLRVVAMRFDPYVSAGAAQHSRTI
ncbi:MAG: coproporphyrinogen III oxidase, partial [Opitutaceae bacterium]